MDKQTEQIVKNAEDDRIKVIKMHGEVCDEQTLADLKMQAGKIDSYDVLVLEIASPGGSVAEGLDIMVWLDQLSSVGKRIVTVVTANSYSIASLIMLVAEIKLISKHAKVMVHNPMVPLLEYVNANDLQQYVDNLRSLEMTMYEIYEFFTGLPQEKIKELMDNETYLSPQEAVDYGFADMIVDIKPKSYEMTSNTKNEINMSKTLNILNKVIGMVNKSEFINQIYSDLDGGEVEIFQADPSTYAVGDKTSMEEGEVVLSDGSKLTIVEGKIAEINRDTEADAVEEEVVDAEFNEGEAPAESVVEEMIDEEPAMDEHEAPIEAPIEEAPIEAPIEEPAAPSKKKDDMPSVVIETTESIITTKETVAVAVEEEVAVVAEEVEVAVVAEEEVVAEMEPKMEEEEMKYVSMDEYKAMEERMQILEAKLGNYESKFEAISKFENIATEAIDTLASNTVSTFKPEAKAASTPKANGSIFNQLKGKRGLN